MFINVWRKVTGQQHLGATFFQNAKKRMQMHWLLVSKHHWIFLLLPWKNGHFVQFQKTTTSFQHFSSIFFWVVIGTWKRPSFFGFRRFLVAQHLVVVTNHLDQTTRDPHRSPVTFRGSPIRPKICIKLYTANWPKKSRGLGSTGKYGTGPRDELFFITNIGDQTQDWWLGFGWLSWTFVLVFLWALIAGIN